MMGISWEFITVIFDFSIFLGLILYRYAMIEGGIEWDQKVG
jgi:hypothetical protein